MYDEYPEYDGPMNDKDVVVPVEVSVSWNNADVVKKVVSEVSNRIYDDIKKDAGKKIQDALQDQVSVAITSLLNTEIQPTSRWGEPEGDPIVIRELLMRDAEAWLTQKVDDYGRSDTNSYRKNKTRVEYLLNELLKGDTLKKIVMKTISESIGDVTKIVQGAVEEQIKRKLK